MMMGTRVAYVEKHTDLEINDKDDSDIHGHSICSERYINESAVWSNIMPYVLILSININIFHVMITHVCFD